MEKHDSVVKAKRQEKNNILSFFVNGKDNISSSVVHEKDNIFILIYSLSYNGRGQRWNATARRGYRKSLEERKENCRFSNYVLYGAIIRRRRRN